MTNLVEKYREMKKRGEKVTALTLTIIRQRDCSTRAGSTSFWSAIR